MFPGPKLGLFTLDGQKGVGWTGDVGWTEGRKELRRANQPLVAVRARGEGCSSPNSPNVGAPLEAQNHNRGLVYKLFFYPGNV